MTDFDENDEDERPEIEDDDFVIDLSGNGYTVKNFRWQENFKTFDECIRAIVERMNTDKFWPNVWQVNDHGNIDLLSINTEGDAIDVNIIESWV